MPGKRLSVRSPARWLGGPLLIVAVWQTLVWTQWASEALLPRPLDVGITFVRMVVDGEIVAHGLSSVARVGLGIGLGTIAGFIVGLLASSSTLIGTVLRQGVELLRPIPPIAWIPLAIVWFGIGLQASVAVVFVGVFFPFAIACAEALPRARLAVAEVLALYGLHGRDAIRVGFPAAIPEIGTAFRLVVGLGWTSVIASELVSAQGGLGYLIQESRLLLQMDRVLASMAAIGVVGFALVTLARGVERALLRAFRVDLA